MRYAIFIVLILATLLPTPARAEGCAVYEDDRQECRLEYTSDLFTESAVDEENFQRFSGPNQHTFFRLKSLPNRENWSPAQIRKEYIKSRGAAGVVYERTKTDFLVLSGYRNGNIFYTKVALSRDNKTICVLDISYPREDKRSLDSIVTRMSRSFAAQN